MQPNCYRIITFSDRANYAVAETQRMEGVETVAVESREFSCVARKGFYNSAYGPATTWAKQEIGRRK